MRDTPPAYELIPLLLVVILVGLIAMAYSLWCDLANGTDDSGDEVDLGDSSTVLHPYSTLDWRRDDLP